jgi:hypothetical protein
VGVARGGGGRTMPEPFLDLAQVEVILQQMRGPAMS